MTLPSPSQRLHLTLLGVASVAKSAHFYQALGWKRAVGSHDGFVKFDLGGHALCLISLEDLEKDSGRAAGTGFGGVALVHLVRTPQEVPRFLESVVSAGGTIVKPATVTPWGVAGYFEDLDGHLFEVDYEPTWNLDDENSLVSETE